MEGDHPPKGARGTRASARAWRSCRHENSATARKTGETTPAGTGTVLYPCAREGGALSDLCANKEAEGPCTLSFCAAVAVSAKKNPASEEAGCVDPVGSVAVAAGPDQDEAVVTLALHQRGVDRGRKARIVELD